MSINPMRVRWRLCGLKLRASPSFVYFPMRGPRLKRTPSVKAPATPCTTRPAIESWNPQRVGRNPYQLQPHEASRIQMTDPRRHASSKYADIRARSISAPDMIDAVVHENRRNAAQKTPEMWSWRFGPRFAAHGVVSEQKVAISPSEGALPWRSCPALSKKSFGLIG